MIAARPAMAWNIPSMIMVIPAKSARPVAHPALVICDGSCNMPPPVCSGSFFLESLQCPAPGAWDGLFPGRRPWPSGEGLIDSKDAQEPLGAQLPRWAGRRLGQVGQFLAR